MTPTGPTRDAKAVAFVDTVSEAAAEMRRKAGGVSREVITEKVPEDLRALLQSFIAMHEAQKTEIATLKDALTRLAKEAEKAA